MNADERQWTAPILPAKLHIHLAFYFRGFFPYLKFVFGTWEHSLKRVYQTLYYSFLFTKQQWDWPFNINFPSLKATPFHSLFCFLNMSLFYFFFAIEMLSTAWKLMRRSNNDAMFSFRENHCTNVFFLSDLIF